MSQFDKIRKSVPSLRNASDEEILRDIAATTGYNDGDVGKAFGYAQNGGLASNRIGAGIDNYQANLYGLGESVAGAVGLDGVSATMGRRRQDNEFRANVSSQRAKELGGVDDWRDVDGFGSAANYVGGLAAQSLPYLGEAAVGGTLARGLMGGTRAALRGAQTVEAAAAARKALNLGSMAGGVAASYPSAVGDILANQRDESGETDLGSAMVGGVPYAAMNAIGAEGLVARGLRPLSQGGGDLLKRVAREGGKALLTEGASETGQEMANQYFGRMAVNPEQTMFNEDANKRYVDSFVGGAALGGVIGGAAGVRRPPGEDDLFKREPVQVPDAPGEFVNPPSLTGTDPEALMGDPMGGQGGGMAALGLRSLLSGAQPSLTGTDPSALMGDPMASPGANPLAGRGSLLDNSAADAQDAALRAQYTAADPEIERELAAQSEAQQAAAARTQAIKDQIEQVKQEALAKEQAEKERAAELTAKAQEFGVTLKGKAQLDTFAQVEEALDQGLIDVNAYAQNLGLLAANKHGEVKKALEAAALMQRLVEVRSAGMINDPMFKEAEQQIKDGQLKQVERFIEGSIASTPKEQASAPAATKTTQADKGPAPAPAPAPGPAPVPGEQPGGAAPLATVQQRADEPATALTPEADVPATVTVGRSGRKQTMTKEELKKKLTKATPIDRQRYLDAMGLEQDTDPTTGAPVMLQVSEPRSFDEVAALEAQRTGKKVTRQAISQALLKFGITEDVINETVGTSAATVSDAELGIDPAANGSGYRVETQLAKATNQGLVDDGNTQTKEQRELEEKASELLKEAGPSTVLARADDAPPTNLPEGATVTDLREQNPQIQAENIKALLAHTEADNASSDWDGSTVPWESLPDTLKADWVTEYVWNLKDNEGDLNFKELESAQANIERDFRTWEATQSVPAPAGPARKGVTGAGSRPGVVAGKQAAKPTVPAADAQGGKTAQTKVDPAKQAWDKLRGTVPQMPAFESLNERQQKQVADLVSREQFNLAAANTVAGDINQDVLGPEVPLNRDVLESKTKERTKGSTVEQVTQAVKQFLRVDTLGRNVFVVDTLAELPADVQASKLDGATQGVAVFDGKGGRKVYLIASQIAPGKVKSVFMHEVGAHIGLEQLLNPTEFKALVGQIKAWAKAGIANKGTKTAEQKLAIAAAGRVMDAGVAPGNTDSELLAYFIEEAVDAGVDPTAIKLDGPVGSWLRRVMQAFTRALIKLGIKPETLTAQDIVDLAYGAAELEVREGAPVAESAARVQESRAPSVGIPSIDRAPEMVSNMLQSMKDGGSWLGIRTMFTEDLIALASKAIPSARKYKAAMDKIEVSRGAMERDVVKVLQDFRNLPAHEQAKGPGSVNQLLMDSTMKREWAFQPDWLTTPVGVNPELAKRFEALSPSAQILVKRVFKHGHDTLQQMQAAVKDNVASEYDAAIAEAQAAGNKAEATKLANKKVRELKDFETLLDMRSAWPYAPLKRFGKHVVMGYSAEYAAAKAAGDSKKMQLLQKDGDHYYVGFAETKAQARDMLGKIAPTFSGGETGTFEKLDGVEAFMGGRDMLGAFQRLRTLAADQKGDEKTSERVNQMMRQMYLTLLAETSARKSELHRRNIAGADGDMMRAFATQGRATAHFVAGLQTNGKINDHLRDMKAEVGQTLGDREQKQAYFNEIMRRHSMNLEFTPSGMIEKAMAGTSVWMLLTNPSYFLVNATQPFMMSAPLMGARYGYARANAELFRAAREVLPVLKDGKFTEDDYSALPKDTQRAIEELANMGVIDISLESVLGKFESASGSMASKLDPVMQRLNGAAQAVESMNRLATAITAYRLAKEKSGHDGAVQYAAQVIYETHGDYSGFNAPRFMRRGVGKLATQFRKFQLIQLSMFARLINRAFKDADPEERFIARKALAFNLAHLGATGGLMGMPAFSMIAWVVGKAIPGDDEPDDPEATLRRLIGDKALADLLLKGAPKLLGVDISGRVGAGGMLSLLPYTDVELSRDGYSAAVTGLLGPFVGGLAPRAADGMGLIAKGELWKGTEQMLPAGFANVLKATRFASDGVTKRNGDVVLSPDEVSMLDWAAQAVGLPTNVTTDRQFLANAQYKADTFYRERTSQLKNEYSAAVRKNDTAAMRETREEWMRTQDARRKLGYEVQPLSTLLKAPAEQRKRERETIAGVQTNKGNRGFVAPLQ